MIACLGELARHPMPWVPEPYFCSQMPNVLDWFELSKFLLMKDEADREYLSSCARDLANIYDYCYAKDCGDQATRLLGIIMRSLMGSSQSDQ